MVEKEMKESKTISNRTRNNTKLEIVLMNKLSMKFHVLIFASGKLG